MNNESFMRVALDEAYDGINDGHGGPFGAVIVRDGEVLSKAHNKVLKDRDPVKHAEMIAISLAAGKTGDYDLSGCTIYSTTEPCPMCFAAIHWARIDHIIYGTEIEDVKALGFNEMTIDTRKMKESGRSPVNITGRFMLSECMELLDLWKKLPDREVY